MRIFKKNINLRSFSIKILIGVIITFICFIVQTSIIPLVPFFASSPNLLLIIIFSYGLLYGEYVGLFTGLFCGLICDMYLNGIFGIYIFIYSILGFLNGQLYKSFVGDSIFTPIMLSIINGFIYNIYIYITHFLYKGKLDIINYFSNIILPNVMFTLIFTIFIYRFLYYVKEITKNI